MAQLDREPTYEEFQVLIVEFQFMLELGLVDDARAELITGLIVEETLRRVFTALQEGIAQAQAEESTIH